MDQIKAQLAVAIKYGFWISSALVLLVSLGIWYMTTAKLTAESASQTSKIKQAIQTVSSVEGELLKHPNAKSHEEMNKLITSRQDQVLQSWQILFDRQRSILTWPEAELTKDFVDEFRDLIPIEVYVEFPTPEAEEKESTLLTTYQRYIKNALPDIAKIGGTEWTADFESSSMMGMGGPMDGGMGSMMGAMGPMGPPVDITGSKEGPLVKWSSASQSQLLSDLFPWQKSKRRPSTLEVYYSQENLWVMKQLLQIISQVNGEARQPYQAKIHEIDKFSIGKSVKFTAGTISKPGSGAGAGMMGMGMDMEQMGMEGMGSSDMGMGMDMGSGMGMGPGMEDEVDPADSRYVNEALEPIAGSDLRTALKSNKPSDVSLAVAKRVPVMMTLKMDQRAVPDLLAACGSAPLMVEVKQVRLLPTSSMPSADMGMGGGMGGEMGGMGSSDMSMGGMSGMGMGAASASQEPLKEFPLDMTVEVYGLINIYNPPDVAKLGLEQVNKENVDELIEEVVPTSGDTEANEELPTPQAPVAQPGNAPAAAGPAGTQPPTAAPLAPGPVPTGQPPAASAP